jgi:hypothetical protein
MAGLSTATGQAVRGRAVNTGAEAAGRNIPRQQVGGRQVPGGLAAELEPVEHEAARLDRTPDARRRHGLSAA